MILTRKQLRYLIETALTDDAPSQLSKDKISFKVDFEGEEYEIEFFEDSTKDLQYKVNGSIPLKKKLQNFVTLASLGLLGQNNDIHDDLNRIVKIDKSLNKYSLKRIKDVIQQKIKTERPGLTKLDIRSALGL